MTSRQMTWLAFCVVAATESDVTSDSVQLESHILEIRGTEAATQFRLRGRELLAGLCGGFVIRWDPFSRSL